MAAMWLSDDEQRAWRSWLHAHVVLQAQLNRQLFVDAGMSEADYGGLVHLSEAPDGRLRGKDLAVALQWEKSRLSHHLSRMMRRGLVERIECPTDGRGAFVVITPTGRARIEAAAPKHAAEVRRWFVEALGPARLLALGEAADVILAELEGNGAGCPSAGDDDCPTDGTDADRDIGRDGDAACDATNDADERPSG
jgi:DNA-binding MarR family transcriptional regulator